MLTKHKIEKIGMYAGMYADQAIKQKKLYPRLLWDDY